MTERRENIEKQLIAALEQTIRKAENVGYLAKAVERLLKDTTQKPNGKPDLRTRAAELESEIRNLTAAVAQRQHSESLLNALDERESELTEVERALSATSRMQISNPQQLRSFVEAQLHDVRGLLYEDVAVAKAKLLDRVRQIKMIPHDEGEKKYYVAEGTWDLLGNSVENNWARQAPACRARNIAGARFGSSPTIPFKALASAA